MKTIAVILTGLLMGACCTKMDCGCAGLEITIKLDDPSDLRPGELDAFSLVTTDKQFHRLDSGAIFIDREYGYSLNEDIDHTLAPIENHNFLLRNSVTGSIDTISDITNIRTDSAFKCNDCFLAKDIKHCPVLKGKKLKLNGNEIAGYTVVIR